MMITHLGFVVNVNEEFNSDTITRVLGATGRSFADITQLVFKRRGGGIRDSVVPELRDGYNEIKNRVTLWKSDHSEHLEVPAAQTQPPAPAPAAAMPVQNIMVAVPLPTPIHPPPIIVNYPVIAQPPALPPSSTARRDMFSNLINNIPESYYRQYTGRG